MNPTPCSFQLTDALVNTLASIAEMIGKLEGVNLSRPNPTLRRRNRARAVQSSLAIEGNSLNEEQVVALMDGYRVMGPERDIREAQNAFTAYRQLAGFDPFSMISFLQAHGLLMKGLVPQPGVFRKQPIGMVRKNDVFHEAPSWREVQGMMEALFDYLAASDEHLLLKSSRFHYQLEYIHPFVDGNGRMGRLWQTRLLMAYHPVFEFLPVESLIREHQEGYYRELARSDDRADCSGFIGFMLSRIREALERLLSDTRSVTLTALDRLQHARTRFGSQGFSRKAYQMVLKTISPATASRDLQQGVSKGLLIRSGDKRTAVYRFKVPASGDAPFPAEGCHPPPRAL